MSSGSRSDVDSEFSLLQLTTVNSTVGLIEATDVDSEPLYYRLESATVRTHDVMLDWTQWFCSLRSTILRFKTAY